MKESNRPSVTSLVFPARSRQPSSKQRKLQEEQSAIEQKQKLHLEEYRRGRWRFTGANKTRFATRPSERMQATRLSLPLIIKGDVDGSVEAILNILDSYDGSAQCGVGRGGSISDEPDVSFRRLLKTEQEVVKFKLKHRRV
uniref:Uncharacterized protein n=1 Tax=Maylandia zebra TaxID=106582 RepID=A0A3P9CCH3_9CICH